MIAKTLELTDSTDSRRLAYPDLHDRLPKLVAFHGVLQHSSQWKVSRPPESQLQSQLTNGMWHRVISNMGTGKECMVPDCHAIEFRQPSQQSGLADIMTCVANTWDFTVWREFKMIRTCCELETKRQKELIEEIVILSTLTEHVSIGPTYFTLLTACPHQRAC